MRQDQLCQHLTWDSEFFGFKIARINGHILDADKLKRIETWCNQHRIDCLYFLAASNHFNTIQLAEENGFHQVDIRVTMQRDLSDWNSNPFHPKEVFSSIRTADHKDLPSLAAIARNSYGLSRFYFDPCFSSKASDALYEEWIRKSTQGFADIVLVAERDGEVVGYITGNFPPADAPKDTPGDIGLVGVAPNLRGQGIGSVLISHVLGWFSRNNVRRVNIVTQGRNIVAQRLYQQAGFLTHSTQLWYHKWLVDCKNIDENEQINE